MGCVSSQRHGAADSLLHRGEIEGKFEKASNRLPRFACSVIREFGWQGAALPCGPEIKGEHSCPGCDSTRPRGELFRADPARGCDFKRDCADDEGVVGCARGGRAPQKHLLRIPDRNSHWKNQRALCDCRSRHVADACGKIVNLVAVFKADIQHVHAAKVHDESQGVISHFVAAAEFARTDDFHSDNAFARGMKFFKDRNDLHWRAVH
jgi:hypothetical protein